MDDLHLKLVTTRNRLGWTQPEFAEHMKVTPPTVIAWEKGRTKIPHAVIYWLDVVNFALGIITVGDGELRRQMTFAVEVVDENTGLKMIIDKTASQIIYMKGIVSLLNLIFNVNTKEVGPGCLMTVDL